MIEGYEEAKEILKMWGGRTKKVRGKWLVRCNRCGATVYDADPGDFDLDDAIGALTKHFVFACPNPP